MALQQRRAEVVWNGDLKGSGKVKVGSGAFPELPVTFAARTKQAGGKTSPEELIAAAHATCFAMAFSNTLAQANAHPERLDISAVCSLDKIPEGLKITTMQIDVRGRVPGLDQARFEELARQAGKNCPVSMALANNVDIRVTAQLER